ncbi:hypothetical protein B5C34_13580 [Pacificimonas flava]|uniref:GGDEF domain-containing protein n=2 Tax=Pacificimonas TaxID=1960290 RepID=A0A219B7Q4_9SPHN|nr:MULTISPECIES: diguanylate cyclase [Pacificimonas]MBZ6379854.1 sensor domain-containing diguanylate cyclase [Pacificimonas aurantium]OWV34387.1 hypothetical protein B5C34_13580 [Pacificimonas flava]
MIEDLAILDTPSEPAFDAAVKAGKSLMDVSNCYISFADQHRQWIKAQTGSLPRECPADEALCRLAISTGEEFFSEDLQFDAKLADHPSVVAAPDLRMFLSVPVCVRTSKTADPVPVGALCAYDDAPRARRKPEFEAFRNLARLVEEILESRLVATKSAQVAREQEGILQDLSRAQRQQHQAERIAGVGSWRLHLSSNEVSWSPQTYAIHGISPDDREALEKALSFYPDSSRSIIEESIQRCIVTGRPYDVEINFRNGHGELRRVRAMGERILGKTGEPEELIGVFQDITEQYEMERQLRHMATIDQMSGVFNRGHFDTLLKQNLAQLHIGSTVSLVLVDLDDFKHVNDRYGHGAGDEMIRRVSAILKSVTLEEGGTIAGRIGGDEFALAMIDASPNDLLSMVRSLVPALAFEAETEWGSISMTSTLGIAEAQPNDKIADLYARADRALYRAKQMQKGCAAFDGIEQLFEA